MAYQISIQRLQYHSPDRRAENVQYTACTTCYLSEIIHLTYILIRSSKLFSLHRGIVSVLREIHSSIWHRWIDQNSFLRSIDRFGGWLVGKNQPFLRWIISRLSLTHACLRWCWALKTFTHLKESLYEKITFWTIPCNVPLLFLSSNFHGNTQTSLVIHAHLSSKDFLSLFLLSSFIILLHYHYGLWDKLSQSHQKMVLNKLFIRSKVNSWLDVNIPVGMHHFCTFSPFSKL